MLDLNKTISKENTKLPNNEEMQMIIVEKVLEEMQNAEQNLIKWKAYWWESYDNIVVPTQYLYDFYDINDSRACSKFFGDNINIYNLRTDKNLGIPLKKFVSNPIYSQDICTIKWSRIETNNSSRKIIFNNNGEITLEKHSKKAETKKHPKTIEYEANYNVTSDNFSFNLTVDTLLQDYFKIKSYKRDILSIVLNDGLLIRKYNDIEIIQDLNTGLKIVRIIKKYDKKNKNNNASVVFEAVLNPDQSLEKGTVVINTHKGNGKVNGTYRFDVSREKGIRANFYSRKGIRVDLTTKPMLLGNINNLMLSSGQTKSGNINGDMIIADFNNSTQKAIANKLSSRTISFDSSDFNMETVIETEIKITDMIKSIKDEIPLNGLVDRINNCIKLTKNNKKEKQGKILKLTANN